MTDELAETDPSDDNLDVIENEDGSAEIVEKDEDQDFDSAPEEFYTKNLAELLSHDERDEISIEFIELIEKDKEDRQKHDMQGKKALESTGLTGDATPAFSGGSVLIHPVLAQASVEFAAAASKEIFPAEGPVRTEIKGKTTRKKLEKAERKRRHMNYQLTEQIEEYVDSIEKMLPMLCLNGSQYIRLYWWETGKRPRAEYISSEKIYLPYHVSGFTSSQRITYEEEMSDMEYNLRVENGIYKEFSLDPEDDSNTGSVDPSDTSAIQRAERKIEGKAEEDNEGDESKIVYNIYCYKKLEKDGESQGYAPYIASVNKHTQELLAIYRNWEYGDETRQAMQWIVEWPMIPWGRSVYSIGTGHLVGQLARGASGALRALLDSGLANTAPTLFMTKAMGMSGQAPPVQLGAINQLRTNAGLDDIRKSIMAPPFNPPSNVLFELLGFLVNAASGMVQSTINDQANATNNVPVGTQLARIEQGMKVFSAIHKRLHRAQKRTLQILHRLNRMYMEDNGKPEDYKNNEDEPLAFKEDYEGVMDVAPVSDPEVFSEQQRFVQAQTVYTLAKENPQDMPIRPALKRLLSAMKVSGIDEIVPDPSNPSDENPAAENMQLAFGKPAQALPEQDHLAHLQTHLDFLQSPAYGQNEAIKQIMAPVMLQHLVQHLVFNYGKMMQDALKEAIGHGYDINEIIGDDGEIMEEMSKAIAAASPMITAASAKVFEAAMPIIAELAKYVQSIAPKPPVDPGTAMLQGEQMRKDTEEKKIAATSQTAEQKAQMAAQESQAKLQAKLAEVASKEKIAEARNESEEDRNTLDNITALEISEERDGNDRVALNPNPRP